MTQNATITWQLIGTQVSNLISEQIGSFSTSVVNQLSSVTYVQYLHFIIAILTIACIILLAGCLWLSHKQQIFQQNKAENAESTLVPENAANALSGNEEHSCLIVQGSEDCENNLGSPYCEYLIPNETSRQRKLRVRRERKEQRRNNIQLNIQRSDEKKQCKSICSLINCYKCKGMGCDKIVRTNQLRIQSPRALNKTGIVRFTAKDCSPRRAIRNRSDNSYNTLYGQVPTQNRKQLYCEGCEELTIHILEGFNWDCLECGEQRIEMLRTRKTPMSAGSSIKTVT